MDHDEVTTNISGRLSLLRSMLPEMLEAGRMRSDFALTHFVVGAHDTPGRQRAQALNELQSLYFSMADVYDDMQDKEQERADLLHTIEDNANTDKNRRALRRLDRAILQASIHLFQRVKEIDCLLRILKEIRPYTAAELEAEEPLYWTNRLARQAFLQQRDPGGNLDAMLQIVTVPGVNKPDVPVTAGDWIGSLGISTEKIAAGLVRAGVLTAEQADKYVTDHNRQPLIAPPISKHRRRPKK